MSEPSKDPQRDKTDRPKPPVDPAEGDLETIEEDLKQKEQGKQNERKR